MKKATFILSKSIVKKQLDKVLSLGVKVSFSFKTNPIVAKIIEENNWDCEFSSHTPGPIDVIKNKSKIWFFTQGTTIEQIKEVLDKGVRMFVIDNVVDFKLFDSVINVPKYDNEITVLFRIKMKEFTVRTGRYYVYGMSSDEANKLIKENYDKNYIKKIGIHFHRKTQNISEWSIKEELQDSIGCWDKINIVNIGGGLPIKYKNSSDFNMDYIFNKIKSLKKYLDKKNIELYIEPGRFISGPAVKLECFVTSVVEKTIFVNCSVYNSFPDSIIFNLKLLVSGEIDNENIRPYLIKGCTPCSMDIFRYKVRFDKEIKAGDKITFINVGAYNFHTDFMWLEKIKTIIKD